jgi:uncharacterized protein (TIGR02145 family)
MKKNLIFILTLLICNILQAQTVTDTNGTVYNTVQIGTQTWMAENLSATKFNDGTPIPLVTDSIAWFGLTSPGYCWFKNDSATYNRPWGALYNWHTVNTGNLCPKGWHIPSNAEWHTLVLFLDPAAQDCYCTESTIAGDALKETGLTHWGNGNNGTNSSGFTAVGTGFRNGWNKTFQGHTAVVYFWTSTSNEPYATVWHRYIQNGSANLFEYLDQKTQAMSVRCIKDNASTGMQLKNKDNNIKIYPNPASDKIFIETGFNDDAQISIFNVLGELVSQTQIKNEKFEMDISELKKGIYILMITYPQGILKQKLIKE